MEKEITTEELPWEERTQQWKTDGECLKCRRHGYCKKQCKKNERLMYAAIMNQLKARMGAVEKA